MTSRPARKSLAGAFQPATSGSDRAESLTGLLPPRPAENRRPEPPPPRAADGALAVVPDSPTVREPDSSRHQGGSTSLARRSKQPEPATVEPDRALVRNVAVYLPVDLLERLRRTSRSRELTYAELVVEASEAHLDEVAARFTSGQRQQETSGVGMPARHGRQRSEPGVQVQIRLDGHQVAWLDSQVQLLRAPSRSALVAALLRAHLGRSK
jgi:hypothetical protein